jgi:hypothetical protein
MSYLTHEIFEGEMKSIPFRNFYILKIWRVTGDRNNDWGDRWSTGRGGARTKGWEIRRGIYKRSFVWRAGPEREDVIDFWGR